MISVIICSINPYLQNQIRNNISETIGVEYEIIVYNNNDRKTGICKVYNECAQKSKYDYLVFCHEDILFHTSNWGLEIIDLLKKPEISLIGVAGATYKTKAPAPWTSIPFNCYRVNALSNINGTKKEHFYNPKNDEISQVVILDGFFMATQKPNWEKIKFDENNLKGFHLYDIDFSLRQKNKIFVTYNILIEHQSEGNLNKEWIKTSIEYHKKNLKKPIFIGNFSIDEINDIENKAITDFYNLLVLNNYLIYWKVIVFIKILINRAIYKYKKYINSFIFRINYRRKKIQFNILERKKRIHFKKVSKIKTKNFSIISSNCWAGSVYEDLKLPYQTPTVGLFFYAPCFIEFLKKIQYYLSLPMEFIEHSKYDEANSFRNENFAYPIGILDQNVEIHFLHYKNSQVAYEKWERRKKRVDFDNLFVAMTDRDLCTYELMQEFDQLPFKKKIIFTAKKYPDITNAIQLKSYKKRDEVGDLYNQRENISIDLDLYNFIK